MFWPIILPAKITFWLTVFVICYVTYKAPIWKWKTSRFVVFVLASLLSTLTFIPVCIVLMLGIDFFRFGSFTHADFDSVNDFRVERYLPEAAEKISVFKYASGYQAEFKIDKEDLDEWFATESKNFEDILAKRITEKVLQCKPVIAAKDKFGFPDQLLNNCKLVDPIASDDMLFYQGATSSNGAGHQIWFSPSRSIAYQRAGYW